MKEPHRKPLSFRANTFARFAKKHDIDMEINPVDPFALVESTFIKRTRNFIASLEKKGRHFTMHVIFERVREELPPIEDILEYIANQVAAFENFGTDVEAFSRYTGYPPETLKDGLEEAAATAAAFSVFLKPDAYQEFLRISEIRG